MHASGLGGGGRRGIPVGHPGHQARKTAKMYEFFRITVVKKFNFFANLRLQTFLNIQLATLVITFKKQ